MLKGKQVSSLQALEEARVSYNELNGTNIKFGSNIKLDELSNFMVDGLLPKVKSMHAVSIDIVNIFSDQVKIVPNVGELIEMYVVLDMCPVGFFDGRGSNNIELFIANYAKLVGFAMANQVPKIAKLSYELIETRKRFIRGGGTLSQYIEACQEAMFNGIARTEQEEILQMWVNYYRRMNIENIKAATEEDLTKVIINRIADLQSPTRLFNQVSQIQEGALLTTSTDIEAIRILSTNSIMSSISTTLFNFYFNNNGIDFRKRMKSVFKFPKVITLLKDYSLTADDVKILQPLNYKLFAGKVIPKGTIIPNDWAEVGFVAKLAEDVYEEYEFDHQNFGFIYDEDALFYAWDEGAGFNEPFKDPGQMVTHLHYQFTTLKMILPFFNISTFSVGNPPVK